MSENKEQKIVVLVSLNQLDKGLILNGIKLASIFRKELCLVYNYPKKRKKEKEKFRAELVEYTNPIRNEIPGIQISTLLLSESKADLPEKLADEFEANDDSDLVIRTWVKLACLVPSAILAGNRATTEGG